jgi:O-antigen ligase
MNALQLNQVHCSRFTGPRGRDHFVPLLAAACVACYVVRHSLVPRVFSNPYVDLLAPATIVVLMITAGYVASTGIGRLNIWSLLLIATTSISLIHCERLAFALPRWLGWVMLLLALGPINSTAGARFLRRQMVTVMNGAFIVITFLSLVWWIGGLPNLGRGDFTGVMGHSMVLGPIAGYVAVLAVVRLFSKGSLFWVLPCGNAWMVLMLASSRAALAAAVIGTLVIIAVNFKRNLVLAFLLLAAAALVAIMPTASINCALEFLPGSLTEGLVNKSWNNSRELHWNARWDEFLSSRATGVGFASAWEDTVGVDEETGGVETGSSYLSILSMTGCLGACAWLALAATLAYRVLRSWQRIGNRERLAICGMASFWAVHLGAEGYVYAVGSLMGAAFWLWLGSLNDLLCDSAAPSRTSRTAWPPAAPKMSRRAVLATVNIRQVRGPHR